MVMKSKHDLLELIKHLMIKYTNIFEYCKIKLD